jgi:uncharacterized protein (DUF58 family)
LTDAPPPGAAGLRARAERAAAGLPPLLAMADHLAATVVLGEHGRRRAGLGDEFWQYRPAHAGDSLRAIDWRRSARSDATFVREKEWQAAQSVLFWADRAQSMGFSGDRARPAKAERAAVLALAAAVLLNKGGERVGLLDDPRPPRHGAGQLLHMAGLLTVAGAADYGTPPERPVPDGARLVFLSDFLGDWDAIAARLSHTAGRGVRGVLMQVLDPVEEAFPFDGRKIFESPGGSLRFETLRACGLRAAYLARLAERKERLAALARRTGWRYCAHRTGDPAQGALLWLYAALEGGRC